MNRMWKGLLGVLAVAVLAGCSSHSHHHGMMGGGHGDAYWDKGRQDMEGLINRTVTDPEKAKQVNGLVAQIIDELKTSREQQQAYHRQLYTLNASYTATPDEFSKIVNESNIRRSQSSANVLSLRFKIKALLTADEWKAITDRMLAYSARYQHGGTGPKTGY
ncbi:MAG: hypothetical protein OEY28_01590 [Nitrospira sp.]|nr:hypothetical protein [Nitrospira sp.]